MNNTNNTNTSEQSVEYVTYKVDDINSVLMLLDSIPITGINTMKNICAIANILQKPITPENIVKSADITETVTPEVTD